jgi:hypothetical protein
MEIMELTDMQKLMPSVERAKLLGIVKEPEQLSKINENDLVLKGIIIGVVSLLFVGGVYYIIQYNNAKRQMKQQE